MIELRDIQIQAGQFRLENINVTIRSGEYTVLMGQTGRGKTTILELICGLRRPKAGKVFIQGVDVTRFAPGDRQIGYVPQDLALFPGLNVREHLQFALKLRRAGATKIANRVSELADLLGIGHLLQRKTTALSGGEAQRVALGRAIAFWPSVLLLDEPLSALDTVTRGDMQLLLRKLKEATGVTTLHVTHDLLEAEALADRRLILSDVQIIEDIAVNQ